MDYILIFGLGSLIGSAITVVYAFVTTAFGTLKIDHSNPEKDLYLFEIDDLDKLSNKKILKLTIIQTFSQK